MRRLFYKGLLSDTIEITGSDAHHLMHVMRAKAGQTIRLAESTGLKAAEWGCYDADRTKTERNPKNKYQLFHRYFNEVAEISPKGELSAKKPGEAVAVAFMPDGTRELFPVSVM